MRKVQKSHFSIPLELKIIFKHSHSDVFIIAQILQSSAFPQVSGGCPQKVVTASDWLVACFYFHFLYESEIAVWGQLNLLQP